MTEGRTITDLLREIGAPDAAILHAATDRGTVQLGRTYVNKVGGDLALAIASNPTYTVRCGRWRAVVTDAQHAELRRLLS